MRTQLNVLTLVASLSLLGACSTGDVDGTNSDFELDGAPADSKADAVTKNLSFTVISADLGSEGGKPSRWLVTSKAGFEKTFKTKAPQGVNWGSEWVYIYSAGTKSTGGYAASVNKITFNKNTDTLRFFDSLESPGSDCIVTYAFTKPAVAVKFKKQGYDFLKYTHSDTTRVCDPCATVKCAAGTHCEEVTVYCITAPCPPIAECVADEPAPVGCAATLCGPNTTCLEDDAGNAYCEPIDPCSLMKCASGTICTHTGNTTASCIAPKFCGGIAAFSCPDPLECVDNPFDSCDPSTGGADCGGICQCTIMMKCPAGYEFNRDPNVCSCKKIN